MLMREHGLLLLLLFWLGLWRRKLEGLWLPVMTGADLFPGGAVR